MENIYLGTQLAYYRIIVSINMENYMERTNLGVQLVILLYIIGGKMAKWMQIKSCIVLGFVQDNFVVSVLVSSNNI